MRKYLMGTALAVFAVLSVSVSAGPFPKNLLEDITTERAKYGADLGKAEAGALLNAVALKNKALGFGLLRKDSGNNCPVAGLAVRVSCDWIVNINSGTGCDMLTEGPGTLPDGSEERGPSGPQWCDGEPFDVSRFVTPVGTSPIDPPIPPMPPAKDCTAVKMQLTVAKTQIASLMVERDQLALDRDRVIDEKNAAVAARDAAQAALANVKCLGPRIFGYRLSCTVVR